jgi:hypothetical protein
MLVRAKPLWRCPEPRCGQRAWAETNAAIRRRGGAHRADPVLGDAPGWRARGDRCVDEPQLGVGWHTVMRAVRGYGARWATTRPGWAGVVVLGVEEHVWAHAGAAAAHRVRHRHRGPVDLTRGRAPRLLDVVPRRTGKVYAAWIFKREQDQHRLATLSPRTARIPSDPLRKVVAQAAEIRSGSPGTGVGE